MSEIDVGKVGMIPTKSVEVDGRARQEMGDLGTLEENLKQSGLISPLAVKDNKDGTFKLLAGERRFIILERNGINSIPARIYERDLSELEMKIIEKSENFHRKDFEYWEYDNLILDITKLEQEAKGVKAPGPGQIGHSLADTGEIIGASKASVSQAIRRAEAREAFPELFTTCKTASDASKVLRKVDEAIVKQAIAQKLEACEPDSTIGQLSKCFLVESFFDGVRKIPDGVMHLVEIDPPYSIGLSKQKKKDGESKYILEDYNEIPAEYYMNGDPEDKWLGMKAVFEECYRVMSAHSWLVCWFAPEPWFNEMHNAIVGAGFGTTRMCPIWTKGVPGQTMNPSTRLPNSYEMFFYAWKGQPALNKPGRSNEFRFPPVPAQQKTHPTERPIELTTEIYDTFAFAGSRVLIPFLGSGNGLISAYELKMSAIGFELTKAYKDSFLVKVNNIK